MPPARPEPPEPAPFTDDEFRAWRGFLRLHRKITDELNRRLLEEHDLPLLHYGVLITLITVPERRMRMTDVAERVKAAWIDRHARKGKGPSDHAPVIIDLDEAPDGDIGPVVPPPSAPVTKRGAKKLPQA